MSRETHLIRNRIHYLIPLIVVFGASQVLACSIPVFRYALENWRPDPYTAYVLHRGSLTAEQQRSIESLQATNSAGMTSGNIIVRTLDITVEPEDVVKPLQREMTHDTYPWLIVQTPARRGRPDTVVSANLREVNVNQLMDSPARSEIRSRLLKGDSVVWVYLESGRQGEDDARFEMLTTELARLESELKLPEIEEEDLKDLAASPESLRVQLSAVRLSRDDEQEAVLCDMLLRVEPDLLDPEYEGKPMAFPIFGRGRALYALVGEGLKPDLIKEACEFLTGACQCTVKAENPGVDLLMLAEWDKYIEPTEAAGASLPPLAGFSGFTEEPDRAPAELITAADPMPDDQENADLEHVDDEHKPAVSANKFESVTTADPAGIPSPTSHSMIRNSLLTLMLAGGAVAVVALLLMRRSAT